jgi:hypothetical protein
MADVRSWRRRKPGSHTREIVQDRLPPELLQTLADLRTEVTQLQARMARIETFLELVNAEYRKRVEAA